MAGPTIIQSTQLNYIHQCEGSSMLPTLNPHGDILLQESLSVRRNPPRLDRGDLVISISPVDPSRLICKRLIGLPGDTICIDPTTPTTKHVLIPPGHVWLQGDNFMNSRDSRMYGPVPMGLLRARVIARVSLREVGGIVEWWCLWGFRFGRWRMPSGSGIHLHI